RLSTMVCLPRHDDSSALARHESYAPMFPDTSGMRGFWNNCCGQTLSVQRSVVCCNATTTAADFKRAELRWETGHVDCGAIVHAARGGRAEGALRRRRNSSARACAGEDVCLGDPQGAPRTAGILDADRGAADLGYCRRRSP